jgi:hypothetical protein
MVRLSQANDALDEEEARANQQPIGHRRGRRLDKDDHTPQQRRSSEVGADYLRPNVRSRACLYMPM